MWYFLTCYLLKIWFKETSGCFNSNWSCFLRWISINACTDTRKCLIIVKNQINLVESVRKNPFSHDFFEIDRIKDSNLQQSEDFAVQVCLMRYRNSFVIFVVLLPVDQQYEWYLKSKMKLNTMGCLCRTISHTRKVLKYSILTFWWKHIAASELCIPSFTSMKGPAFSKQHFSSCSVNGAIN